MPSLHKISDHVGVNIAILSELNLFAGYGFLLPYLSGIDAGTALSPFPSVTCCCCFGGSLITLGNWELGWNMITCREVGSQLLWFPPELGAVLKRKRIK